MVSADTHEGAAPPAPPATTVAQPTALTALPVSYTEQVRESMDLLRALFLQLDAAGGSIDGPPGLFEPCRGRPGVRLDPVTWQELSSLIADGSERALGALGRTPLQIKEYWDYRDAVVLKRFSSVTDYLLQKIFGLPTAPGPDGHLVAQVPTGFFSRNGSSADNGAGSSNDDDGAGSSNDDDGAGSSCRNSNSTGGSGAGHELVTVWRDNDFPYYLERGIKHYNLWANRPLSQMEVEQHIAQHAPTGVETLWFVNPPVLQSVPAIWHAHILVRHVPAGAATQSEQQERGGR